MNFHLIAKIVVADNAAVVHGDIAGKNVDIIYILFDMYEKILLLSKEFTFTSLLIAPPIIILSSHLINF